MEYIPPVTQRSQGYFYPVPKVQFEYSTQRPLPVVISTTVRPTPVVSTYKIESDFPTIQCFWSS